MTRFETSQSVPSSVTDLLGMLRHGQLRTAGIDPAGTGFEPLDTVLDGGFLPGDVILLGGQPGSGKTIGALQWARNVAQHARSVAFACFEHDETALLNRLLVQEIAALDIETSFDERVRARNVAKRLMLGTTELAEALTAAPILEPALRSLQQFAPNLQLLRASSQLTTPAVLDAICTQNLEPGGLLVVDYLQKLPVPGSHGVAERVYHAVEILKELAITHNISVLALSAADDRGINAGRLRLEHLRGSAALAHECDVAIVLNQKVTATSDRHIKFDLTQLDEARKRSIFTIEKNRRGEVDIHLEFVKDFANFRFVPQGEFVSETLQDEA